jgi:hypothetical protein
MSGHFDGKVIIPDEPVNLPVNQRLRIDIEVTQLPAGANGAEVIAAFENARKHFSDADLDAMEEAMKGCRKIEDDDEDIRL